MNTIKNGVGGPAGSEKAPKGCTEMNGPVGPTLRNISRRELLGGILSAGAFIVAARVVPRAAWAQDTGFRTRADGAALHPSVYLGIEPDGTVIIVTNALKIPPTKPAITVK